jgi:carboxyl-terminal processing protease
LWATAAAQVAENPAETGSDPATPQTEAPSTPPQEKDAPPPEGEPATDPPPPEPAGRGGQGNPTQPEDGAEEEEEEQEASPEDSESPGDGDEPGEEPEPSPPPGDSGYEQIERLTRAIEIIRQSYVDEEKISYESLINSALQGMLADLDPHCQYLHPQVFAQMKREQTNTYDGVGVTISNNNGVLTIVSVREDGPAATAGVLPGDVILEIGDRLTEDLGLTEAVRMLEGNPGETLALTLRRPATKEVIKVEMVRQVIQMDTVKDPMLLAPEMAGDLKIGYVRLLQFNEPTASELADALDNLEDSGMEALVLDLRNNPGGLLNSAIDILGIFLDPDTLVLTTEGRVDSQNPPPYHTPARQLRQRRYPLAVLVNHGSASASEVVSGALQDLKRAVIVGETTFGKGSVQSIIPVGDGAALRLTTAKYYTPSHRTIHERGITPNVVATLTPAEEKALFKWWRDNSLNDAKAKDLVKVGDRQLQRAVDVLKGLTAYRETRR